MYFTFQSKKKLITMFVTVETIENGCRVITAVPASWVCNELLRYPQSKSELMAARKKCSVPQQGWLEMPCKVVFKNIGKY